VSALRFAVTRPDGRSVADVLSDLIRDKEPGTVFPYDDLVAALSHDGKQFDRRSVQAAVYRSFNALLKREARALRNSEGVGYVIVHAQEHRALALGRKDRADAQIRRGITLLRNVKLDEMDENARLAHEGTLLVLSGYVSQQQSLERRLRRIESVIEKAIGSKSSG
jgi:hypothetical protein